MNKLILLIGSATVSALLLTFASPGYDLWPLAYIALIPFLISIPVTEKGFLTGWTFGFLYFFINLRWVTTAVSDFGNSPYIVGLLLTLLFAAFLGLFWGLFGYLYAKKRGACLMMAGVIVALEVVKSTAFSGFPMLNLAHTQYTFPAAIQIAEITGEYGISLLVAYANIALASAITDKNRQSILLAVVLIAASFSYGLLVKGRAYAGNDLQVRIIQPSYPQSDKWVPDKKYDIMALVNSMVRASEPEKFDLLVLPETVYPAFLNSDFAGFHMLEVFSEKIPIIAGGIRYTGDGENRKYHNSVFLFDKGTYSVYDKLHLVPFGEYFPLKTLFKPIDYYFFKGAEDFSPGDVTSVFTKDKFTAAPMVCYESMYSTLVRDQAMLGSDIITIVTNDSWFGDTKGPYQHLATDVLRAVEFRKPVVRASQSGISACISPAGVIDSSLPTGEKGFLDCKITTHKGLTMFASGGYGWLAIFLICTWYFSRRKNKI